MNVEVFVLCDAATDNQGKLNMLGAFDSIWAQSVPVVHPFCALAVRIRFLRIEEGVHPIKITIIEEDGKNIVPPIDGNINIKFSTDDESVAANLIINLQGLRLEKFGNYSIELAIHGKHEASVPLFLKQLKQPPQDYQPPKSY
ncbi:MAG TPA: hypothetical protein PLW02_12260 [Verrucomicrobiota bacterium]|nr:hypothetical protein [Verrucomicrobiota bacterium]